jgi:ribosomal protein S18 acetylase RimI-like enzyme
VHVADEFVIRAASPADQAFISEMQHEAFFVPPGAEPFPRSILDEPQIRKYHADFGTETGDVGFIAESSAGEPLGAAWVRLVEGYGFVDHETPELGIAVGERARDAGIGTALLEHLLAAAPRCSLSVDTRNRAMRLYDRLGFTTVRVDGDWTAVMLRSEQIS